MMEVTINWACIAGDGFHRFLVDVPSVGNSNGPNPFDGTQANIAIDAALREFRGLPPLSPYDGHQQERCIRSITLHQTEDRVIPSGI